MALAIVILGNGYRWHVPRVGCIPQAYFFHHEPNSMDDMKLDAMGGGAKQRLPLTTALACEGNGDRDLQPQNRLRGLKNVINVLLVLDGYCVVLLALPGRNECGQCVNGPPG